MRTGSKNPRPFSNFGQFLAERIVKQGYGVLAHSRRDYSEKARELGVAFFRFRSFRSRINAACAYEDVGSRGENFDADSDDEEEEDDGRVYEAGDDYVVVNFYHFVDIEDAHGEVARHAAFMEGRNIRGRIYINHQGINAQFSGPREDAIAYSDWVKADERFSPIYIPVSPSPHGHAFPRLKLQYKPSLVQVTFGKGGVLV